MADGDSSDFTFCKVGAGGDRLCHGPMFVVVVLCTITSMSMLFLILKD
jgi:hypothetical protein